MNHTYTIRPSLGFDWYRFELGPHRFRDRAEAEAYLARLARPPTPPGPDPELRAMADEAAALLRLRQFDYTKKKNPEPEPVMPRGYETESEEIPF